jgi:hypothetical protein
VFVGQQPQNLRVRENLLNYTYDSRCVQLAAVEFAPGAHFITRGVELWTVKIANARSSGETRRSRKSDICFQCWTCGACISACRSLAGLALPRRARPRGVRPKLFIFVKAGKTVRINCSVCLKIATDENTFQQPAAYFWKTFEQPYFWKTFGRLLNNRTFGRLWEDF